MNPATQEMTVVMCSDDNVVLGLTVTVCSMAGNLSPEDRVNLYLFDGGIQPANRKRFEKCIERFSHQLKLTWITPDLNQLQGLRGMEHLTLAAYLRLLIPILLPPEIERAIYLDCDLVVRASIRPLWVEPFTIDSKAQTPVLRYAEEPGGTPENPALRRTSEPGVGAEKPPVKSVPLLAARDQFAGIVSAEFALPETYQALGLRPDDPYFNSGIMVLDLTAWRNEPIADAVLRFLKEHSSVLRWADQDGLNAVLSNRVKLLDERWNYQYGAIVPDGSKNRRQSLAARRQRVGESFIVHYTSKNKPWYPAVLDPERAEFLRYLRFSLWLGTWEYLQFLRKYLAFHINERFTTRIKNKASRLFGRKAQA